MTRITTILISFLIWTIPTLGQSGDTIADNIIVPKIFTPDKDGADKVFHIKSLDNSKIISIKMQIFDRWGKIVFETNDIEKGWNGQDNEKPLPSGTYFYSLKVEMYNNINELTDIDHSGHINLIR